MNWTISMTPHENDSGCVSSITGKTRSSQGFEVTMTKRFGTPVPPGDAYKVIMTEINERDLL